MVRLSLTVPLLVAVLALVSCGQPTLSEEDIRSIVQEEAASQLASAVPAEVMIQLASAEALTLSELRIVNDDGEVVLRLTTAQEGHGWLEVSNRDGKMIAYLGAADQEGQGLLVICNSEGNWVASLDSPYGYGLLRTFDEHGQTTLVAP